MRENGNKHEQNFLSFVFIFSNQSKEQEQQIELHKIAYKEEREYLWRLSFVCDYKEMIYDHGSCMMPDFSAM